MKSYDKIYRICLCIGSLCLLIAIGWKEALPDFFLGLFEGAALALMLSSLVVYAIARKNGEDLSVRGRCKSHKEKDGEQ